MLSQSSLMAAQLLAGAPTSDNCHSTENFSNLPLPSSKSVQIFLLKLYHMLSDESSNLYISWTLSGASFVIPRPKDFSEIILPKFFKHNKFTSFVRQLNMYGFYKVPNIIHSEPSCNILDDSWEFANPLFLRGKPHLLGRIIRKRNSPSCPLTQQLLHRKPINLENHINNNLNSNLPLLQKSLVSSKITNVPKIASEATFLNGNNLKLSTHLPEEGESLPLDRLEMFDSNPYNFCVPITSTKTDIDSSNITDLSVSESIEYRQNNDSNNSSLTITQPTLTNSATVTYLFSELESMKKNIDNLSSQQYIVNNQLQSVMSEFYTVKNLLQRHQTDIDIIMSFLASLLMMTKGLSQGAGASTQPSSNAFLDESNPNLSRKQRRLNDTWGCSPATPNAFLDSRYVIPPGTLPDIPQALVDYITARGAGGDMHRLYDSFLQSSLDRSISSVTSKNNLIPNDMSKIIENMASIKNQTASLTWPTEIPPILPNNELLSDIGSWNPVIGFNRDFIGSDSLQPFDLSEISSSNSLHHHSLIEKSPNLNKKNEKEVNLSSNNCGDIFSSIGINGKNDEGVLLTKDRNIKDNETLNNCITASSENDNLNNNNNVMESFQNSLCNPLFQQETYPFNQPKRLTTTAPPIPKFFPQTTIKSPSSPNSYMQPNISLFQNYPLALLGQQQNLCNIPKTNSE